QVGAAADETGDELKLPEAKQGTKSLNQLTAELQRLEKELLDLPVGSKGFVDLAQKVKTAQKELEDAEAVARKLGGTVGRKGNAGMAVLEFRLTEGFHRKMKLIQRRAYGFRNFEN
ncbi:transposase, partial [Luteolibacter pohnpeiensis]|uniref:transposase n=1 Tax=Luteolibacter pohnpeiensis TaxID=454153 RepID=UPI001F2506EB